MEKSISGNPKGQSAVEFALIAPLLFVIFFGIIQLAYMAYAALAVQRAAMALARESSMTGERKGPDLQFELAYSLLPLAALNRGTLGCVAASTYTCSQSRDGRTVTARVDFPLWIWVPGVGRIFGEPLLPPSGLSASLSFQALQEAARLAGKDFDLFSRIPGGDLRVHWMRFSASTYNEGYLPK